MKSIHVVFDDTTVLQRPVTTVLEILLTNNNMDDNYIHTPFHIAGKLIQMRGFGHRAYWDVFGSITVQCKPTPAIFNHAFHICISSISNNNCSWLSLTFSMNVA